MIWRDAECIHRWLTTILRATLDEGVWMVLVVDKEQGANSFELLASGFRLALTGGTKIDNNASYSSIIDDWIVAIGMIYSVLHGNEAMLRVAMIWYLY